MFAVGITNMIFFFCYMGTNQYPAIGGERVKEKELRIKYSPMRIKLKFRIYPVVMLSFDNVTGAMNEKYKVSKTVAIDVGLLSTIILDTLV